jgi:hypothetical protein
MSIEDTTMDREGQVAWLATLLTELIGPDWETLPDGELETRVIRMVHQTFGGR